MAWTLLSGPTPKPGHCKLQGLQEGLKHDSDSFDKILIEPIAGRGVMVFSHGFVDTSTSTAKKDQVIS